MTEHKPRVMNSTCPECREIMYSDKYKTDAFEPSKFGCIIADPNWVYQNWSDSKNGAAKAHYALSPTEEICRIPVSSWATEDCVLALWATLPKLPDAFEVMEAWGFRYITAIPWVKILPEVVGYELKASQLQELTEAETGETFPKTMNRILAKIQVGIRRGIGFWTQSASELLLIGVRGQPKRLLPREETPIGLLHTEDRVFWHTIGKHSTKPEDIQTWLEKSFCGPFLELYAVRERAGWTTWGLNTGFKLTEKGVEPFTPETFSKTGHALERAEDVKKQKKAEKE